MPDIHHEWARNPPDRWHCKHCPATTWNPVQAVCPGRVVPVSAVTPTESTRTITGLPDLGHDWKPVRVDDGPFWYECRCLAPRSPVPHRDSFCPDAVLDYANRLVADERARAVAVLEGLRSQMVGSAAAARSGGHSDYHDGRAAAHEDDAELLDEALTTLTGSDR